MNEVNLSGVKISDHFIELDKNKINLWQLSIGAIPAKKEWAEPSDKGYKKIDLITKPTQVRVHTNINSRMRGAFFRMLKVERAKWHRSTYKELYMQLLAEGKIPNINNKTMQLKTFMNYCLVLKRSEADISNLKDAIIGMYKRGVTKPKTIATRLGCSVSVVHETLRKSCVS